ncbi:MAG: S8 family peptidase [SAR202 cluster bacterium]|jgi:subtilisin|nr:S8 family peptidase [SAR202 cluster bacterium]
MVEENRQPMIVTFRRKDQRTDEDAQRDKLSAFAEISGREDVNFYDADKLARGVTVPSSLPQDLMGYDVNRFEAPIVMAMLSEREVERLRASNSVESVENDGEFFAADQDGFSGPDTFLIEGQPTVQAETVPAGVAQIKAPKAWDVSRGKGIKVFVLDTGIDGSHPDLASNYKGGTSFVPSESSAMDYNSHGTHCAGTIAAAINGAGVVGVAPSAYLYAVKVLSAGGSGQWSWLIAGIDWCLNKKGPKILSMSLSGSAAPGAVEAMCKEAYNEGALLVAAAGNSGGAVQYPAAYDSVVAVSAIDNANNFAGGFSCRGLEIELSAPGVSVLSTLPGGGYGTKTGTSMACPHVSGAAALTWGSHRFSDNVTIRDLLGRWADNLGIPGRDNYFGYGRVDADQSAFNYIELPLMPGTPTTPIP